MSTVTRLETELAIPGYHGYYATAGGDIISYRRAGKRRVLKRTVSGYGYEVVTLYDNASKQGNRYVHQLILEAHGMMRSVEKDQVRHKDGNKTNNVLSNIEWCDGFDNYEDRIKHGTCMSAIRQRLDWNTSKGSRDGSYQIEVETQAKTMPQSVMEV